MITTIDKPWGMERILVNNDLYCAKTLRVIKGYQSSLQYHREKDETFFIQEGIVKLELKGEILTLTPGQSQRIRPKELHRFTAETDTATILEISTTHWEEDTVRVEQGGKIKGIELPTDDELWERECL